VRLEALPSWRVVRDPASGATPAHGTSLYFYELDDHQFHLESGRHFVHQRIQCQRSQPSLTFVHFHPEKETFILHHLRIHEDEDNIKTCPKSHLQLTLNSDGSVAVSLLDALKSGDIVDISFSCAALAVSEEEPASLTVPLEWNKPRQQFYLTIHVPPQRKARASFHGPKVNPKVIRKDDGSRLITWYLENAPASDLNHEAPRSVTLSEVAPEYAKAEPKPNAEFVRKRRSVETGYPSEKKHRGKGKLVPVLSILAIAGVVAASFHFLKDKPKAPDIVTSPPTPVPKPEPADVPEPSTDKKVIGDITGLDLPAVRAKTEEEILREVNSLIQTKDYDQAEKICRDLLADVPASSAATIALAEIQQLLGDEAAATSTLDNFLSIYQNDAHAWQAMAQLFYKKKQVPNAIWAAEQAKENAPEDSSILLTLSEILYHAERFEEAEVTFERASIFQQDSFKIWEGLGLTCMRIRKYPDAVTALQRAIAIEPEKPQALNNLAAALMHTGDNEAAEKHLKKCISLAPDYQVAWENLIDVYERLKQPDGKAKAKAELAKLRSTAP